MRFEIEIKNGGKIIVIIPMQSTIAELEIIKAFIEKAKMFVENKL